MLPIAERYEAEEAAIEVNSGFRGASTTYDAAIARKCDLRHRILSSPAETVADLVVQAQIAKDREHAWAEDAEALALSIFAFAESQGCGEGGANV